MSLQSSRSQDVERGTDSKVIVESDSVLKHGEGDFDDLEFQPNWTSKLMAKFGIAMAIMFRPLKLASPKLCSLLPLLIAALLYNIFFFGAAYHHINSKADSMQWCNGFGLLIIITVTLYILCCYFKLVKPKVITFLESSSGKKIRRQLLTPAGEMWSKIRLNRFSTLVSAVLLFAAMLTFAIVDTAGNRDRMISGFGILVMIFIGLVFSKHPHRVVWRQVLCGLGLQFTLAFVIIRSQFGRMAFQCLGDKVVSFLEFTDQGSTFVYGPLVNQKPFLTSALNKTELAFKVASRINEAQAFNTVFVFKVLSIIYFFSFFTSLLFHLGWMQFLVIKVGWILEVIIGTTACESMSIAANIFLGLVEAPLIIKPYLQHMTHSELHAVMTGGFATIAGNVMAAYISVGISASHLLSASVMSAPAALAMAKLMYPETKKSKTVSKNIMMDRIQGANLLDAAIHGSVTSVGLVANICATLISVLACKALLNSIISWCGNLVGIPALTVEFILGSIFVPFAWLMGVPNQDLEKVGVLLGLKMFGNEFLAYQKMAHLGDAITSRSHVISTYALCGFANPASMGMQLVGLSTMAPSRREDIARVALRAFVAGSLANFMMACVAGLLID